MFVSAEGIDGLAGGEAAVASSFFFLVFAYYGQYGWAVANLVVAAASMGLVLPFANFILDATLTLFRRLIRREKWYQAHRSHFYQRMTDLGMTHRKVTSIELLVVVASCAAAAACIPAGPTVRIALVVSVTVGIACGGLWVWGQT
jgi:UDP-N-acetylmuramyl pentapeptide phosphotransferase/UDP-N-acetylglucosamine-1-phosphate transferase